MQKERGEETPVFMPNDNGPRLERRRDSAGCSELVEPPRIISTPNIATFKRSTPRLPAWPASLAAARAAFARSCR